MVKATMVSGTTVMFHASLRTVASAIREKSILIDSVNRHVNCSLIETYEAVFDGRRELQNGKRELTLVA